MRDSPIEMTREAISRLAAGDTAGANWLINAAYVLTRWPETPDASDETRLAAGWVQQVCHGDSTPPGADRAPSGWAAAPGSAGAWRYQGSVVMHASETMQGGFWVVWLRWLAPAEAAPIVRTHWLRDWRPVCGAPATEPSARVLDQERTCLRCLEVVDGVLDAVEVSRG